MKNAPKIHQLKENSKGKQFMQILIEKEKKTAMDIVLLFCYNKNLGVFL